MFNLEGSGEVDCYSLTTATKVGDKVQLVFRSDADPPFTLKVRAPGGKVILERVLRDLPTGKPQSAQPVQFAAVADGEYRIEISQLYGEDSGEAKLVVAPNEGA